MITTAPQGEGIAARKDEERDYPVARDDQLDEAGGHAAFRAASAIASSSSVVLPVAANTAHLSAGMRLRALHERTA